MQELTDLEAMVLKACELFEDFKKKHGDRFDEQIEAYVQELVKIQEKENCSEELALYYVVRKQIEDCVPDHQIHLAYCGYVKMPIKTD